MLTSLNVPSPVTFISPLPHNTPKEEATAAVAAPTTEAPKEAAPVTEASKDEQKSEGSSEKK